MFEYWFHGLNDGDGNFTHHGVTHDFLEVLCQMALLYNATITGNFVKALLIEHDKKLSFLRVADWKFEYLVDPGCTDTIKITLEYTPR